MKLKYTVGHYEPETREFDTDSPAEALRQLAEWFVDREGSRVPTLHEQTPLTVEVVDP